jgi:hypothetical protein
MIPAGRSTNVPYTYPSNTGDPSGFNTAVTVAAPLRIGAPAGITPPGLLFTDPFTTDVHPLIPPLGATDNVYPGFVGELITGHPVGTGIGVTGAGGVGGAGAVGLVITSVTVWFGKYTDDSVINVSG